MGQRTAALRCTSQCSRIPRRAQSGRQIHGTEPCTRRSPLPWLTGQHFRYYLYSLRIQSEPGTGRVDYDQMEEVALREKPKMIIGGGSAYSREWDYKRMREIADKIGAILMIDMAHPAGLIAAGELDNPVKYAHIVTSTTHKTLRGPRGGVIMMGKDFPNPWGKKTPKGEIKMMSQLLDSAYSPVSKVVRWNMSSQPKPLPSAKSCNRNGKNMPSR